MWSTRYDRILGLALLMLVVSAMPARAEDGQEANATPAAAATNQEVHAPPTRGRFNAVRRLLEPLTRLPQRIMTRRRPAADGAELKIQSIRYLAGLQRDDHPQLFDSLLASLDDDTPEVRREALTALRQKIEELQPPPEELSADIEELPFTVAERLKVLEGVNEFLWRLDERGSLWEDVIENRDTAVALALLCLPAVETPAPTEVLTPNGVDLNVRTDVGDDEIPEPTRELAPRQRADHPKPLSPMLIEGAPLPLGPAAPATPISRSKEAPLPTPQPGAGDGVAPVPLILPDEGSASTTPNTDKSQQNAAVTPTPVDRRPLWRKLSGL